MKGGQKSLARQGAKNKFVQSLGPPPANFTISKKMSKAIETELAKGGGGDEVIFIDHTYSTVIPKKKNISQQSQHPM